MNSQKDMNDHAEYVIGVDLAGPANVADTVLVAFESNDDRLRHTRTIEAATDAAIWRFLAELPGDSHVTIGLDAPLSYNPGGGDRPADAELRLRATAAGLTPGSIMPPTLHRMIYLTARGMAVARGLRLTDGSQPVILEVHPGAALALHGAAVDDVRAFARTPAARLRLLKWLETQGLGGIGKRDPASHYVAACAAAFAAWRYAQGRSQWLRPASPPEHPYDYCA